MLFRLKKKICNGNKKKAFFKCRQSSFRVEKEEEKRIGLAPGSRVGYRLGVSDTGAETMPGPTHNDN